MINMATIQVNCENPKCGTLFPAREADRKRGWARFCSKSCKAVVQEKKTGQWAQLQAGTHKSQKQQRKSRQGRDLLDLLEHKERTASMSWEDHADAE